MISSLVVFCGSSMGYDPVYAEATAKFGQMLGQKKITVIYGGGRVGLMGVLANSVREAGGKVVGVIPTFLNIKEIENHDVDELIEVTTMHERKQIMANRSDAAVALPGGLGTFEELCEFGTWTQLYLHQKPIGLYNVAGYYEPLIHQFVRAMNSGFIRRDQDGLIVHDDQPERLFKRLQQWVPTHPKVGDYKLT